MKKIFTFGILLVCLFFEIKSQSGIPRDTIIVAAREIINDTHYCGLGTIDLSGQPQIRTMNPFPVKEDMVIWFATSRTSRKIREIRNNPRVSVYWADHVYAKGYVNISGTAQVIDDKKLLVDMKREYWEGIKNWQNIFVLIKIVPETIEVINYKHNLNNDPDTFKAPSVVF